VVEEVLGVKLKMLYEVLRDLVLSWTPDLH
jgi:hypothetical protein